jgi:hypothetical protein
MMSTKNAIQPRDTRTPESFRIFPDGRGHWYAYKNDGLVAGIFFNQDAAIRFARDESPNDPSPKRNAALDGDTAVRQAQAPIASKVRRAVILAQIAFVGFLLIGRVAASVVDASALPSFDSSNASSAN